MSLGAYMVARPHLYTEETRLSQALEIAQRYFPYNWRGFGAVLVQRAGVSLDEAARYWRMWLAERPGIGFDSTYTNKG